MPAAPSTLLFGLVLGLALSAGAVDCSTEDIAETGAGIGRTKFGHRPFFLIHLTGLDRQSYSAGRAVDRCHLGVDFLTDGETVRALFAAIAG